jgi:hypothetical protein
MPAARSGTGKQRLAFQAQAVIIGDEAMSLLRSLLFSTPLIVLATVVMWTCSYRNRMPNTLVLLHLARTL